MRLEQYKRKNRGQSVVEYALLIPMVCFFAYMSFMFYQGYVQGNLYGRTAQNYNYYSATEIQAYGQEMAVALPFP